jgi:hypothetical protein
MTSSLGDIDDPLPLAKALRIVKRNRVLANMVRTVPLRVNGQGCWGQIDGPDLGVWLELRPRRPVRVDAVLPAAPAKGECEKPYRQTWRRYRARNVREISLLVDLRRRKVADIDTDASVFEFARVPGRPYPSCVPR